MSEPNEQKIWADKKMPALEFCKLDRAAELLEVKEEDILHWASLGAIDLCLLFKDQEASISPPGWSYKSHDISDKIIRDYREENEVNSRSTTPREIHEVDKEFYRELQEWFISEIKQGQQIDFDWDFNSDSRILHFLANNSTFSTYAINAKTSSIGLVCSPSDTHELSGMHGVKGSINGFWHLPVTRDANPFKEIALNSHFTIKSLSFLFPVSSPHEEYELIAYLYSSTSNDSIRQNEPPPLYSIGKNDLYIMRECIEFLYNNRGKVLDSFYSDEVTKQKDVPVKGRKALHGNVERNAKKREQLLMSAIYLLSKYPEECKGVKKDVSPERWRDCLLSHKDEVPQLMITNEDVILKHLRAAVNGKGVE